MQWFGEACSFLISLEIQTTKNERSGEMLPPPGDRVLLCRIRPVLVWAQSFGAATHHWGVNFGSGPFRGDSWWTRPCPRGSLYSLHVGSQPLPPARASFVRVGGNVSCSPLGLSVIISAVGSLQEPKGINTPNSCLCLDLFLDFSVLSPDLSTSVSCPELEVLKLYKTV